MNNTTKYAEKIAMQLSGVFEKDSPNYIPFEELEEPNNFESFIYALGAMVPWSVYNQGTDQNISILSFTHLINALVFRYEFLGKTSE